MHGNQRWKLFCYVTAPRLNLSSCVHSMIGYPPDVCHPTHREREREKGIKVKQTEAVHRGGDAAHSPSLCPFGLRSMQCTGKPLSTSNFVRWMHLLVAGRVFLQSDSDFFCGFPLTLSYPVLRISKTFRNACSPGPSSACQPKTKSPLCLI